MLNETLTFDDLRPDDQRMFIGIPEKRPLPAGYRLYKFTQYAPHKTNHGHVTPWWSSVEPLAPEDPGLAGTLDRSGRIGGRPNEFARARSAVTKEWNAMTNFERVRLMHPVWAFVGRCRSMLKSIAEDEDTGKLIFPSVYLIGGAWQLFIPSLPPEGIAIDL